ncbi:MAG TPA: hypothetical protein VL027_04465 [Spongiibacteraceae bacterium]|nr:hypothetical protein [Spongiibacteraceae bacterium]
MRTLVLTTALLAAGAAHAGPYAPAAGQPGSTALHASDPAFVGWATGYTDYQPGSHLDAAWQNPARGLGKPGDSGNTGASNYSGDIVGLGRGGSITLTFDTPIINGEGYDFAVFENSFSNNFLELAWVEVSSNGSDFFRFGGVSLTPNPVGGFGSVDPTNIDGFAGKYRGGWGTPFDLDLLAGIDGLDVMAVQYIRLVDIVGDGNTLDSLGNPIYEPYPTVGSAGFDLDAIGAINVAAVPVPAAAWLFASALGLLIHRKRAQR